MYTHPIYMLSQFQLGVPFQDQAYYSKPYSITILYSSQHG